MEKKKKSVQNLGIYSITDIIQRINKENHELLTRKPAAAESCEGKVRRWSEVREK